ncbi:MAG: hypothetical protein JJU00_14610 [Opitutales bacterium]|nr:hypothetical protein [Opitutales bacterium]
MHSPDSPSFVPRARFGARGEPESTVLHGAGQDAETFSGYTALFAADGLRPCLYMAYAGLRGLDAKRLGRLSAHLREHADPACALQLGLSMTRDGTPEAHYEHEVAEGRHDAEISLLAEFLSSLERDVYLRVGYECNGPWNGYAPESYRAAFRRVVERLRPAVPRLATVWCVEGGFVDTAMDYYPCDDAADWWSIDLFGVDHFAKAPAFLAAALEHRKPVMIGECTPRRVGVEDGAESWERWYSPFFGLIRGHAAVKAFCYINWEWSKHPQWADWGNARVQDHPEVLRRYRAELRLPLYGHLPG